MELRPSEIYFSQAKINNHFGNHNIHRFTNVGETLDDLVDHSCSIDDIPTISVIKRNGRWVTADNRRLWVFRHLEKLGKCTTIPVRETSYINPDKLNSLNGGRTVRFYPGRYATGRWHHRVRSIDPGEPPATNIYSRSSTSFNSMFTSSSENEQSRPISPRFDSYSRQITSTGLFAATQTDSLASVLRTLSTARADTASELNPSDIRYSKESVHIDTFFFILASNLCNGLKNVNDVDPVTVYEVCGKHWVTDGNKRLWSFKQAKSSRIKANIINDNDEFLHIMRKDRPWLSLIDIIQSGDSIQTI